MQQIEAKAPAPSMRGMIWFGSGGVALIVGGLVAVLAANWSTIPFWVQVCLALLPLAVALGCYGAYVRWQGARQDVEEVLGILWSGGVLCATALLGRVLQLSSSSFAFCMTVTGLLVPVVVALRARSAWVMCAAFGVASAMALEFDAVFGRKTVASLLAAEGILVGVACFLGMRVRWVWAAQGAVAAVERFVAAVGACLYAVCAMAIFIEWERGWPEWGVMALSGAILWVPLALGLVWERSEVLSRRPLRLMGGLPLLIAGVVMQGAILAGALSERGFEVGGGSVLTAVALWAVALAVLVRRRWTPEGWPLLVVPMLQTACFFPSRLAPLISQLALAAGMMGVALWQRSRWVANVSLGYLALSAWVAFVSTRGSLMARGVTLMVGGVALLALNLLFARIARRQEVKHG